MLSEKMVKLLNEQVNKELYSAYLYLDMANFYTNKNLKGFANWYYVQAQEEMAHAMLFRAYVLREGYPVELEAIARPDVAFAELVDPLKAAYQHEVYVTGTIHNIYAAAQEEKDYRTITFVDWFVKEQAEEEENASDLVQRFELFGQDMKALYLLDAELATRTYTPPTLTI
ncbi:ferritin [Lachnospiraceae bacterium oral taxon 500]|nr:ferritin [Lachnospiraceae bacterium oral taxon 500]